MSLVQIAISGKSGCGNSTVSRLVAEALGIELINYTFRNLAQDMGMEFEELRKKAELDSSYDKKVDENQLSLAQGNSCVLGSRLAIWLLKTANLKVFLTAPLEFRASLIVKREGGNIEDVMRYTEERDRRDQQRYLKLYGIDNDHHEFADLIIDTSKYDQFGVADIIIEAVKMLKDHGRKP
jgi:cytidylate kinase